MDPRGSVPLTNTRHGRKNYLINAGKNQIVLVPALNPFAPSSDKVVNKHDQCHHEQEMDQPTTDMTDEPKQPQYEQNHNNRIQHIKTSLITGSVCRTPGDNPLGIITNIFSANSPAS
jgi:hypothetical protein